VHTADDQAAPHGALDIGIDKRVDGMERRYKKPKTSERDTDNTDREAEETVQ
jgi:hypothetical protein